MICKELFNVRALHCNAPTKRILNLKQILLDLVFPKECVLCGTYDVYVCDECMGRIKLSGHEFCPTCQRQSFVGSTHEQCRPQTALDGIVVTAHWPQPAVRELVYAFKYTPVPDLASSLGSLINTRIEAHPYLKALLTHRDTLIIPVPLHYVKERQRGFNQAAMLAQQLSGYREKIKNGVLKRRLNISQQAKVASRRTRFERIKGIFSLTPAAPSILRHKNIVLVDDLVTTGATLNECAQLLKIGGASSVWAVTLAHG